MWDIGRPLNDRSRYCGSLGNVRRVGREQMVNGRNPRVDIGHSGFERLPVRRSGRDVLELTGDFPARALEIIELVGQFPALRSESFVNRACARCATRGRNRRGNDWSRCWSRCGWRWLLDQSVLKVSSVAGPTRNLRFQPVIFFKGSSPRHRSRRQREFHVRCKSGARGPVGLEV